jgi:Mn-dependent DtxR family transcriptional regulator
MMYHFRAQTSPMSEAPATIKYTKQLMQAGYLEYNKEHKGTVLSAEGKRLCRKTLKRYSEVLQDISDEELN